VFILDTLLIGSLRFVLDKVAAAAEAELHDDTALRDQLLEAQMRLELGELTDEEFRQIEHDLLARIREIRGAHAGPIAMSSDTANGVEVRMFEEGDR
jgi:hypothetical protein